MIASKDLRGVAILSPKLYRAYKRIESKFTTRIISQKSFTVSAGAFHERSRMLSPPFSCFLQSARGAIPKLVAGVILVLLPRRNERDPFTQLSARGISLAAVRSSFYCLSTLPSSRPFFSFGFVLKLVFSTPGSSFFFARAFFFCLVLHSPPPMPPHWLSSHV